MPSFQISQRYSSDKSNYDHGTSLILDLSVILEQNEALPSWRHSFPYAGYGKVVLPHGRWLETLRKVGWQRWENGVGSRWQGLELHKGCVCSAHSSHTDCHSRGNFMMYCFNAGHCSRICLMAGSRVSQQQLICLRNTCCWPSPRDFCTSSKFSRWHEDCLNQWNKSMARSCTSWPYTDSPLPKALCTWWLHVPMLTKRSRPEFYRASSTNRRIAVFTSGPSLYRHSSFWLADQISPTCQ